MSELNQFIDMMLKASVNKIIISKPAKKSENYKKIVEQNQDMGKKVKLLQQVRQ